MWAEILACLLPVLHFDSMAFRTVFLSCSLAVCAGFALGCGSAATSVLAPGDVRCALSLALNPATIGASGGSGTLTVTTSRECPWTASASSDWLRFTTSAQGQGPGTVAYTAAPNRSLNSRAADVSVGTERVSVSQQAATCSVSVTPAAATVGSAGGNVRFAIATDDFCPWTAESAASWITLPEATRGTGPTEVIALVSPNPAGERVGTIDVAGTRATVTQQQALPPASPSFPPKAPTPTPAPKAPTPSPAPQPEPAPEPDSVPAPPFACAYVLSPTAFNGVPSSGSTLQVTVTTDQRCTWSTSSNTAWILPLSGSTGTGNGTVALSILANSGGARAGTVTIAGQDVTINQLNAPAAACSYTIKPTSHNAPSAGATVNVAVTTTAGCAWSLADAPSWVAAAPLNGVGSGTTTLTIQANTAGARNASFTIATHTFTVNQAAAPCAYAISPSTFSNVPAAGGSIAVTVTTAQHCDWTVSGAPGWIGTSLNGGKGAGSVTVTVEANTGAPRTTRFKIASQDFSVSQGACAYTVSPSTIDVSSDAQTKSITVTTQSGCPVAATTDVSWIQIVSSPTTGSGSVIISIERNRSPADRSGNVTITGANFTRDVKVDQEERD